jgi:hypothetical protein
MQMDDDLAADPVDVVAALAAQLPGHGGQYPGVDFLAVVLVGADVAVLAERAPHVAGGEEDRARALGAAVEDLLAGVVELRADARARSKLADAELGAGDAVDAAVPWAEVAVRKHAVRELPDQLQEARPFRGGGKRFAPAYPPPSVEEARRQPFQLGPQRLLVGRRRVKVAGNGRGDAELRRAMVLSDVQVPR